MDLLRHLRRLSVSGARWLQGRPGPVAWFTLVDGGVVAAVEPDLPPEEIRLAVRITAGAGAGPEQVVSLAPVAESDGQVVHFAPLDPALFRTPSTCTVSVTTRGRTRRRRFRTGPGLYAGRVEGVRDYGLEGWVSPLFADADPTVRLLVDGRPAEGAYGAPVRLDRFRPGLMRETSQGGWNGFRLLLPPRALDGAAHRLGVRAGETVLDLGVWQSRPKFHIEAVGADRLTGWFFDRSADDVPGTIRVVEDGVTRAAVRTHPRGDIKAAFGRDWASFSVENLRLTPGSALVAGPEGTGLVVGHVGDDRLARVGAVRREARALLLGGGRRARMPGATLAEREALRRRLREVERAAPTRTAFMRAAVPTPAPVQEPRAVPATLPPVCAIVPVYNGLSDLKLCLASLIPQLGAGVRALVIDDASPDPAVGAYLQTLATAGQAGLTILSNPQNLGFIGTVNRGLALLAPGEDALLVNADTVLPPGTAERLSRHCHARPGIASVTPMSNTATILSFPSLTRPNPPALGLDVAALDRAFQEHGRAHGQAHGAQAVEIPTGVGFCMHLNRAALDEVGGLDPDWGRGYCEEVDWCLAARDLGWVHLAATDIFVVHEGSVSFTSTTRLELLEKNHARLETLYPEYLDELRAFARRDPLEPVRAGVLPRLLAGRFRHLTLHLTHGLGGGTRRYVDDIRALPRAADHEVAVLIPRDDDGTDSRLELAFDRAGVSLTLTADSVEAVLAALEGAGVSVTLQVNSRLTYRSGFLERLLSERRPYVVMLHDFQWYCPRVTLTDGRKFYCGEPPPQVCQICVGGGVDYDFADQAGLIERDLDAVLAFNARILRGARKLLAPSRDTAERYRARFGLDDIAVVPHPEPRLPASRRHAHRASTGTPLRVAVVGAIVVHKGFELLLRLAECAARARAPFHLTVIGHTPDTPSLVRYGNAAVTGPYEPDELGARLAAADPDFVLLPSVWPETYSYVLSEIWSAGYPVVAFDFGAQAERIRASGGGVLIPPTRDPRALLETLMAVRAEASAAGLGAATAAPIRDLAAYYRGAGLDPDGVTPAAPSAGAVAAGAD